MSHKRQEMLQTLIMFPMMILSCGVLGAYLLRLQLTLQYFAVIIPLIFASYVSCRGFYRFILSMEVATSQARIARANAYGNIYRTNKRKMGFWLFTIGSACLSHACLPVDTFCLLACPIRLLHRRLFYKPRQLSRSSLCPGSLSL